MWKVTFISALVCAAASLGECGMEKASLSRQMTITMPKSITMPMGNQLYTVSMTKSSMHVNSTDPNHKPCDMAIDPAKDSIEGDMRVAGIMDRLYVWGEHSVERVDGQDRTKYSLMIVNPQDCTLKSADMKDVNVGMTPSLPRMIVHNGEIDFFFPSMKTCAPCRFDKNGKKLAMPAQITAPKPGEYGRIHAFQIRRIGPNYLYIHNMDGHKAMMKMLDGKNMNVMKEKEINYPIDAIEFTKADVDMLGVCSKNHDHMMMDIVAFKDVNCERIDSKLESHAPIKMTMEPYSRPISRVSYSEGNGNSYVGFAQDQDLRVYVHDNKGKLIKSYDMGKIDERFEKYEHRPMFYMPYSHWDVEGFIVGKEYCLVTMQVADNHEVDLHDVRCINM